MISSGSLLHRLHKEAVNEGREQEEVFEHFRTGLDAANVAAWDALVEAYERDPKNAVDPYVRTTEGVYIP